MSDYKELIGDIDDLLIAHPSEHVSKRYLQKAADAIEQLMHERFLIGEILVTESKWEIEPETALEQIRRVLRGE